MTMSSSPLTVTHESPAFWRATFTNPPLNLYDPDVASSLTELVEQLESNDNVKVVVFDSAVPDYFMAHVDLLRIDEIDRSPRPRTGLSSWPDLATRLAYLPCVTIAAVRGRARGVGNELAMAMDMRFASREKAVFGQLEIGCGAFPGGGGIERLHILVGRARAMEIIVGGYDYDADTAERYGLINRAVPDDQLDEFVDRFARRVASFDRAAISAAKRQLNALGGIPRPNDLSATQEIFFGLLQTDSAKARIKDLFERGLQQAGDLELNMGDRLGPELVTA